MEFLLKTRRENSKFDQKRSAEFWRFPKQNWRHFIGLFVGFDKIEKLLVDVNRTECINTRDWPIVKKKKKNHRYRSYLDIDTGFQLIKVKITSYYSTKYVLFYQYTLRTRVIQITDVRELVLEIFSETDGRSTCEVLFLRKKCKIVIKVSKSVRPYEKNYTRTNDYWSKPWIGTDTLLVNTQFKSKCQRIFRTFTV